MSSRPPPSPRRLLFVAIAAIACPGPFVGCGTFADNQRLSRESGEQANDLGTGTAGMSLTLSRAFIGAAIKEPLSTARVGAAMAWQRPSEIVRGNLPASFAPAPDPSARPGSRGFERLLDAEGLPAPLEGNLRALVDGDEFFQTLHARTGEARSSIAIQVFIFDNDDVATAYAETLRRRADEDDVDVRVLFDDLGTTMAMMTAPETPGPERFVPPKDIGRHLGQDSALRVRRTLNPWLMADHTKLFVFDRTTALLGGMNLGREYRSEWHDLMAEVTGPVVDHLADDFDRTWRRTAPLGDFRFGQGRRADRLDKPAEAGKPGRSVRVLRTDIAAGRYEILKAIVWAIRSSRDRVWIETPYFSSDEIGREVIAAAQRGVDVRVVIPDRCNSNLMDVGNRATANDLLKGGVKVYAYPGMTHLKAIVCDDWAMIGSANLDTLSMRINRELNLASADPAFVADLENRVFRPDFRKSPRMKMAETKGKPLLPLAETLADQL